MVWCMHRTNIYLSDRQVQRLDAIARDKGMTRSSLIRDLLDRGLVDAPQISDEVRQALGEFADRYQELIEGMFDDDPDLCIER